MKYILISLLFISTSFTQSFTDPFDFLSESYGSDVVTNGTFASDANWTKGAGWTISGGVAVGSNTSNALTQTLSVTVGKFYLVTYTVVTITGGSIRPNFGGITNLTSRNAVGTYTEIILCPHAEIRFVGTGFSGTIDNVIVREVQ